MEFSSVSEAAKFGMNFERARLEAASQNLALANIAYSSSAEAAIAADRVAQSVFVQLVGLSDSQLAQVDVGVKTVYDPGHPIANSQGNIFYVDVDPIREMATLVSAIRAYEANVRAYNTNKDMNASALSIGGR